MVVAVLLLVPSLPPSIQTPSRSRIPLDWGIRKRGSRPITAVRSIDFTAKWNGQTLLALTDACPHRQSRGFRGTDSTPSGLLPANFTP
jgi:hypothetical protein